MNRDENGCYISRSEQIYFSFILSFSSVISVEQYFKVNIMAHGLNTVLKRSHEGNSKTGIGSRRIFAPAFKLQVLDSYRNDADCKGNQRATARKYGIHRRQIQKWLQVEVNLRNSVLKSACVGVSEARKELALNRDRQRDAAACQAGGEAHSDTSAVDKRVPDIQPHEWRRSSPIEFIPSSIEVKTDSIASIETLSPSTSPLAHVPLDFTTHSRRSPTPDYQLDPTAPIDLSLKPPRRVDTPLPCPRLSSPTINSSVPLTSPVAHHPDIWDLSLKRPLEESPLNSNPRPMKLFKPYLDNVIEEVHSPPEINYPPPVIITNLDSGDNNIYHPLYNNNNYHPDYHGDYSLYNDYYYSGGLHFVRENYPCVKQRQSYSVDFKLSAIECYYRDAVCRGNQRAVASKFKIHRRQVQKWLKQEEQLRQRVQPLHIVR